MGESNSKINSDDKAGYNQSQRITDTLGDLRTTFVAAKLGKNYPECLDTIRSILDVIAGKVNNNDIDEIDKDIYEIERKLPIAMKTYQSNGCIWIQNAQERMETIRLIEKLYRKLEKMQNRYGYGMISKENAMDAITKT